MAKTNLKIVKPAEPDNFTRHYLEQVSGMRRSHIKDPDRWHYLGCEDLVLREGKEYKRGLRPKGIPPGRPKHCFMNAFQLAERTGGRYAYVEGYATGIIPTLHAWNVDSSTGEMFDVTWEADMGVDYIGIEIPRHVLRAVMLTSGVYGAIDAWTSDWPLLKQKLPDFKDAVGTMRWMKEIFGDAV